MKVLITGGTGFIGSALARALVDDGDSVVVLTRNPNKKVPTLPEAVRLVGWDARSGEGWSAELEGADAIVNLAGENFGPEGGLWTTDRKRRIKESRVHATEAVVDAIRRVEHRPKVLIQASGINYYGTHGDERITEEHAPGDDFLAEVAQAWEAASAPVEELGVRRVLIRSGIVLAGEATALRLLALPHRLFVGGPIGSGKQYIPWIHLQDEIGAMRFLMERDDLEGPFNFVAPDPVTNREFSKVLGDVLNRPSFFPAPAFVLRTALGEMSVMVLEGLQAVPSRLQEAGYEFRFPDLQGALQDIYG